VRCEHPRGTDGEAATTKLEDDALRAFRGVLGHFHVQTNKIDPGPAFDWEGVAARVRKMREEEGEDDR
jgi:N-acetyl-anhydromuramyl-L-alanine amidase AmpD